MDALLPSALVPASSAASYGDENSSHGGVSLGSSWKTPGKSSSGNAMLNNTSMLKKHGSLLGGNSTPFGGGAAASKSGAFGNGGGGALGAKTPGRRVLGDVTNGANTNTTHKTTVKQVTTNKTKQRTVQRQKKQLQQQQQQQTLQQQNNTIQQQTIDARARQLAEDENLPCESFAGATFEEQVSAEYAERYDNMVRSVQQDTAWLKHAPKATTYVPPIDVLLDEGEDDIDDGDDLLPPADDDDLLP